YGDARDFPAIKGPSYLSVHLRFGTVSIRALAGAAHARTMQGSHGAAVWLSELIWRDFYFQILHHYPHVVGHAFKPAFDAIHWEHGKKADALFKAWCEGRTGYPLVDAAMAQINQSGYMHNRLRMVVASFLVKDLGIDWRWGERYFAEHLNDFDLAANNGGWQWASSTGCDAQPWFRIFNPVTQSRKFDPEGKFIRKYLPQLGDLPTAVLHEPWTASPMELLAAGVKLGDNYPMPVVHHDEARSRTLQRYAVVKKL
ncbi:MAG: FAD-binding domain-containing protein, partial [Burkholderiaceae bacterium]|nr:FAD-binding domain-containing protein [Burkholderiaceae bacterium]